MLSYSPTEGRVFIQTHGIPNMDFLCRHENSELWTKNAVNLLGLALWKNTQLLGTSNVISFLLGAGHALQCGWSEKIGDYDKEMVFVSVVIWMKSRSEGRDRPRGPTSYFSKLYHHPRDSCQQARCIMYH